MRSDIRLRSHDSLERENWDEESLDASLAGRERARFGRILASRGLCGVGRDCGDEHHRNRDQHNIHGYGNKTNPNLNGANAHQTQHPPRELPFSSSWPNGFFLDWPMKEESRDHYRTA